MADGYQFEGGPLDGGTLDDLPGPLLGMVFTFLDPAGGVRSTLAGAGFEPSLGAHVNRTTFSTLTQCLAQAAGLYGLNLRDILDDLEQAPTMTGYVHPSIARGGRSL